MTDLGLNKGRGWILNFSEAPQFLVDINDLLGLNGTRFARSHFSAPKDLDFQGPPLPLVLEMDLPPSKSLRPVPKRDPVYQRDQPYVGTYSRNVVR